VERQLKDPESMLAFYRELLTQRRTLTAGIGDEVRLLASAPGTLAFSRGDGLVCMVNCGSRAAKVPTEAGELLMSSGEPLVEARGVRRLAPDTAAWFRPA
jgi:alpha-glucosidase